MLHRHFYDYERFDAVRAKEMKEAREDIVFTALKADPEFIAMTALADQDPSAGMGAATPAGASRPAPTPTAPTAPAGAGAGAGRK
jgi:hypothetical protein